MIDIKRRKTTLAIATLASLHRLGLTRSRRLWIRGRLRAALALGVLVLTLSVGAPPAYAATFMVTNTNDSGPGSLRQAVLDANATPGLDTITFSVTGTITLTSGQLTVTDHLTIDGTGAAILTISGNNTSRVMEVSAGVTLDLRDVTVANGKGGVLGGGIFNSGTLTVANSAFSANSASLGGGIATSGPLTVTSSTFSGNTASDGGGIFGGPLTVTDSTFVGNPAPDGGGIVASGGSTVTNSTFSGNGRPTGGGGPSGFGSDGGGILNHGTLTVTNSTFSGNSGDDGGGINNSSGGTVTITNSTFADNFAGTGGGIFNESGTLTLRNTIVANSPSGGNCSGVIIDGLGNLQHPGTDCGATITSADPLLGPLAANDGPAPDPPDGPTKTHALLPGSPAIDAAVACPPPTTDQRGVSRPQGTACDIGAFELEGTPCPPGDDDLDDDGLDDKSEDLFGTLLNDVDSDDDGIRDGNDDGDDDGEDDEDEDDGTDACPEDEDDDGEDDEDEDDD